MTHYCDKCGGPAKRMEHSNGFALVRCRNDQCRCQRWEYAPSEGEIKAADGVKLQAGINDRPRLLRVDGDVAHFESTVKVNGICEHIVTEVNVGPDNRWKRASDEDRAAAIRCRDGDLMVAETNTVTVSPTEPDPWAGIELVPGLVLQANPETIYTGGVVQRYGDGLWQVGNLISTAGLIMSSHVPVAPIGSVWRGPSGCMYRVKRYDQSEVIVVCENGIACEYRYSCAGIVRAWERVS